MHFPFQELSLGVVGAIQPFVVSHFPKPVTVSIIHPGEAAVSAAALA